MPLKLRSLNKLICIAAATQLLLAAVVHAQIAFPPPAPIWAGEGAVPEQYSDRKVFLYPDEHSVVLLWPDPNGIGSKPRRMSLHNVIYSELRVHIESISDSLVYSYDLENAKQSEDSITTFSVVIYPDANLQAKSELWTGGKSTAIVGQRIGLPKAPPGGLAIWFCPEAQPLPPGKATKFTLITQVRPGFTTAATEHYPHLDTSDEWPEQILHELDPVLDPRWIDQHIITLGPRYSVDAPATTIAADYLVGIRQLIRNDELDGTSPFVREVLTDLEALASGPSSRPFAVRARPTSALETEIFGAMRLSLGASAAP